MAEQRLIGERLQLVRRLEDLEASSKEELAVVRQTADSLKCRLRQTTARCQQLTRDLRRAEDQLRLATAERNDLETETQFRGVEKGTQTVPQLDSSALYQLLVEIMLIRLDQLEHKHLPSRDPSPANRRRRTTSLPAGDDATVMSSSPRPSADDATMTSWKSKPVIVKSATSRHLDFFKKFHVTPLRGRGVDVIGKRRSDVTADVTSDSDVTSTSPKSTSSFDRLRQRRNGLQTTDLPLFFH